MSATWLFLAQPQSCLEDFIMAEEESGPRITIYVKTAKEKKSVEVEENATVKEVCFTYIILYIWDYYQHFQKLFLVIGILRKKSSYFPILKFPLDRDVFCSLIKLLSLIIKKLPNVIIKKLPIEINYVDINKV